MISKTSFILVEDNNVQRTAEDFIAQMSKTIEEMQNQNLTVEIQYKPFLKDNNIVLSALLIGRT